MRKTTVRYWICQVLGWGGWISINLFFVYLFASDMYLKPAAKKHIFYAVLVIEFLSAIIVTHALRYVLKKINWIKFSTQKVIGLLIVAVTISGLVNYYGERMAGKLSGFSLIEYEKKDGLKQAIAKEKQL